jgi:CBS domain-containing protein
MPKCSDVMTREPVCCEPGESVTQIANVMKREDVGSIPVVESHEDKKLIGIVTDRDLVVKVLAEGLSAERATVRDAMTANPVACKESDDVSRAVEVMGDRQVRRMPIVDDRGRLTGIIAQADVATRVHSDRKTGELVEAISEPGLSRK